MTFWLLLTVNSVTFGGLLFLLSAGFSLIFGLMRIPNLTHGSMFMLGAYFGTTLLSGALGIRFGFWLAAVVCAIQVAILGALMERLLLRRLAGQQLAQVLVTLGVSFMVADLCLMGWGGDPISVATPPGLTGFVRFGTAVFPLYRLAVIRSVVGRPVVPLSSPIPKALRCEDMKYAKSRCARVPMMLGLLVGEARCPGSVTSKPRSWM